MGGRIITAGSPPARYSNTAFFNSLRKRVMKQDFSWKKSATEYMELYDALVK